MLFTVYSPPFTVGSACLRQHNKFSLMMLPLARCHLKNREVVATCIPFTTCLPACVPNHVTRSHSYWFVVLCQSMQPAFCRSAALRPYPTSHNATHTCCSLRFKVTACHACPYVCYVCQHTIITEFCPELATLLECSEASNTIKVSGPQPCQSPYHHSQ